MGRTNNGSDVLRVFVAAPGEEEAARLTVTNVLRQVNDEKAKVQGRQLKAVGSADSMLGRLLPQALVDRALRAADLVVLALSRHWDDPETYPSSFETLYVRARDAGQTVWLYFLDVEPDLLARPDEPLRRVLDFRDRLEAEGQARCYRCADEADWHEQLYTHLCLWLDRLPLPATTTDADAGALEERLTLLTDELAGVPEDDARAALDLIRSAWAYAGSGRLTRAEELFVRSAAQVQPYGLPVFSLEHARFLAQIGLTEKAQGLLKPLFEHSDSAALQQLLAGACSSVGRACETRGDLDAAKQLYRQALALNGRRRRRDAVAADYGNLGNVYWMQGRLDKAEYAYRQALALNEALGRRDGMAADYGNLGNVYGVLGRLEQAEQMYRKALALNQTLGRYEGMANQYGNLGILFRVQGRLEQAEQMYLKAIEIEEKLGRRENLAADYGNLGNVYQEWDRLDEAEATYRKALALAEERGDQEGMANQYGNLGIVFQARGQLEQARAMYRRALAIFEALGDFATIEQVQAWISSLERQHVVA